MVKKGIKSVYVFIEWPLMIFFYNPYLFSLFADHQDLLASVTKVRHMTSNYCENTTSNIPCSSFGSAYACENEALNITCSQGFYLYIRRAMFKHFGICGQNGKLFLY